DDRDSDGLDHEPPRGDQGASGRAGRPADLRVRPGRDVHGQGRPFERRVLREAEDVVPLPVHLAAPDGGVRRGLRVARLLRRRARPYALREAQRHVPVGVLGGGDGGSARGGRRHAERRDGLRTDPSGGPSGSGRGRQLRGREEGDGGCGAPLRYLLRRRHPGVPGEERANRPRPAPRRDRAGYPSGPAPRGWGGRTAQTGPGPQAPVVGDRGRGQADDRGGAPHSVRPRGLLRCARRPEERARDGGKLRLGDRGRRRVPRRTRCLWRGLPI
ncbi:MAG: DegV family protein, partial [uncultured Rubrobacteraceae bacterium]